MNEGLPGPFPSMLHSALKIILKVRDSLNVLLNLQKLSLPVHKGRDSDGKMQMCCGFFLC